MLARLQSSSEAVTEERWNASNHFIGAMFVANNAALATIDWRQCVHSELWGRYAVCRPHVHQPIALIAPRGWVRQDVVTSAEGMCERISEVAANIMPLREFGCSLPYLSPIFM